MSVIIICICISISGCASPVKKTPVDSSVKQTGLPLSQFSAEEKSQLLQKVYEEPVRDESDIYAKDITLTALNKAIKSPGKPGYSFNQIDLRKADYDDLCHRYRVLSKLLYKENIESNERPEFIDTEGNRYWAYTPEGLPEKGGEPAEQVSVLEIIRLTALYSMGNEIERRGSKTEFWKGFGSATTRATGIALRVALTLAKYMI